MFEQSSSRGILMIITVKKISKPILLMYNFRLSFRCSVQYANSTSISRRSGESHYQQCI